VSRRVAFLIWEALAAIVLIFAFLLALEGYLFWTGQAPITSYIRPGAHSFIGTLIAVLLIVLVSFSFAHFVLDGARRALARRRLNR
jgi:hypothetical protein